MASVLEESVKKLPGIGPVSAQVLAARGIHTLADLIDLIPVDYEDCRTLTAISALQAGEPAMVQGVVKSVQTWFHAGKRLLRVTLVEEADAQLKVPVLELLWFRPPPGIHKRVQRGQPVRVFGKPQLTDKNILRITHPRVMATNSEPRIVARYPKIEGVAAAALQKALRRCAELTREALHDAIPSALREAEQLMCRTEAYRLLHTPELNLADADLDALQRGRSLAHERLRLESWFLFELERLKQAPTKQKGLALAADLEGTLGALEHLAFEPTRAQKTVIREIIADLSAAQPMRRLLQGDVGSGKTLVAWLSALHTARSSAQSAFLAPTELLAEQHFTTLNRWAQAWGVRVALLTGSMTKKERDEVTQRIRNAKIDLVVGTHALLSEGVEFARLGLVIVDEQHRFGVAQRLRLLERHKHLTPHLLVMTATPIPRSLAWILYAGMAVSVIDELPKGRIPIATDMLSQKKYPALRAQIKTALQAGGRVFVICPAIEEQEDFLSVEKVSAVLTRDFGSETLECVHGQLDAEERERRFSNFRRGQKAILVSTTLVEVGVDVPEANLMVVMQAERYGLAQLHQLRGRVGRGALSSTCLLVHGPELGDDARSRLQTLCEVQDGFAVAEKDLALRGPGELMGLRQSGLRLQSGMDLQAELQLWQRAKAMAERWLQNDPQLSGVESEGVRIAQRDRALSRGGVSVSFS